MNNKSKFALIYPFYPRSFKQTQDIPLGICHIKSKLSQMKYYSKVFDLNFTENSLKNKFLSDIPGLKLFILKGESKFKNDLMNLTNKYNLFDFDILCFSIYSFEQLMISLALSKLLKKKNKIIVFGGSFCEMNTQLLEDFKFIDYIITGTGEIGLESLIKSLKGKFDKSNTKNIAYRENNSSVIFSQIENKLSSMSIPDFSDLRLDNYKDATGRIEIPYCIGIGCTNRCYYCSSHMNNAPLYKDPKQIGRDIKYLRDKYNTKHFFLICNFFNISEAYMTDVSKKLHPLGVTWATCITYKDISLETLMKMKQSGCVKLLIGLESGSQRLLEKMNKNITLSRVNLLKNIKSAGINNRLNIILDLPGEEKNDVLDTVFFLRKHDRLIDDVHFILFQLNKGGYIFEHPTSFGVKLIKNEKDFFWKYLYNYNFIYTSDNRQNVMCVDKYRYYELIKPFLQKYKTNMNKEAKPSIAKNKIIFYYHHFGGYGHGMRIYSICKALKSIGKYKILVINSGVPQPELNIENYAKVYNLPPVKAADSLFSGLSSDLDIEKILQRRKLILNMIMSKFKPNLAIIEHFPFGRLSLKNEIVEFINQLKQKDCRIYSSVRDLILSKGAKEYLNQFNGIFIHDDPELGYSEEAPKNSFFTGRVHPYDLIPTPKGNKLKQKLNIDSKKLIVASIGGGLDGYELLTKLINVKNKLDKNHPSFLMIFTGNTFPDNKYLKMENNLPNDCKLIRFDSNLMDYVHAADLYISMAGYNSLNSHLLTDTPSMLFPRLSDQEQSIRAELYGFQCYNYATISEDELLQEISSKLSISSEIKKPANLNGAQITAKFITKALNLKNVSHVHSSTKHGNNQAAKIISDL